MFYSNECYHKHRGGKKAIFDVFRFTRSKLSSKFEISPKVDAYASMIDLKATFMH